MVSYKTRGIEHPVFSWILTESNLISLLPGVLFRLYLCWYMLFKDTQGAFLRFTCFSGSHLIEHSTKLNQRQIFCRYLKTIDFSCSVLNKKNLIHIMLFKELSSLVLYLYEFLKSSIFLLLWLFVFKDPQQPTISAKISFFASHVKLCLLVLLLVFDDVKWKDVLWRYSANPQNYTAIFLKVSLYKGNWK